MEVLIEQIKQKYPTEMADILAEVQIVNETQLRLGDYNIKFKDNKYISCTIYGTILSILTNDYSDIEVLIDHLISIYNFSNFNNDVINEEEFYDYYENVYSTIASVTGSTNKSNILMLGRISHIHNGVTVFMRHDGNNHRIQSLYYEGKLVSTDIPDIDMLKQLIQAKLQLEIPALKQLIASQYSRYMTNITDNSFMIRDRLVRISDACGIWFIVYGPIDLDNNTVIQVYDDELYNKLVVLIEELI